MAVEMKVAGIAIDAANHTPIVVLRDLNDRRAIPIWIGKPEASAILHALEGRKMIRPMTHDLLANFIDTWGVEVEKIIIHGLKEQTFYAVISTRKGDVKKEIDARPSDAIALALRLNAPIWVMEEIISEVSMSVNEEADMAEQEAFKDFLDSVRPGDFTSS
jgi:uncharacterized protein